LYCGINNLTHLNVSENTVLQGLHCVSNNFSETALNALFETLHNIIFEDCGKIIFIDGNQGTNQCDKTIAEKKGWEVIFCIDKPKNHTKSKQSNKSKFRQKNR